jgi:hypothetical protein
LEIFYCSIGFFPPVWQKPENTPSDLSVIL